MAELPRIIVITDWREPRDRLARVLGQLEPLGGDLAIQHRHPGATARQLLDEARFLRDHTALPLFVNGRLDVALLVGAHVHLPSDGADVADVRAQLPPGRWVSVAVHDAADAARAKGADFALVAPVFPPGSKVNDTRKPLGPEGFLEVAARLPCPAYALGGVYPDRLDARGFHPKGVGTLSKLWRAASPDAVARQLLRELG